MRTCAGFFCYIAAVAVLCLPPRLRILQELWPGYHKHAPTPAHHFIRLLHQNGLLHTVFTQNIDGLEQIAGLPAHKVVNAHGSFDGEARVRLGLGLCLAGGCLALPLHFSIAAHQCFMHQGGRSALCLV